MTEPKVSDWIDRRQSLGTYTFTKTDLLSEVWAGETAVQAAIRRLKEKGRLISPIREFYVIVPLEYQSAGGPPPSWYIDDLMRAIGQPYYVGLLTAAALHGAAHHRPQEFQVVTDRPIRSRTVGRSRLRFLKRTDMEQVDTQARKTETGHMLVSSPEQTALDLLRYVHASGHLSNVTVVLKELADQLRPEPLVLSASRAPRADVQRLGYLLSRMGHGDKVAGLRAWLQQQAISRVPLRRGGERKASLLDETWAVYVNADVLPDS